MLKRINIRFYNKLKFCIHEYNTFRTVSQMFEVHENIDKHFINL